MGPLQAFRLDGRVVIVTGGTRRNPPGAPGPPAYRP
jgi:hypothetical protein